MIGGRLDRSIAPTHVKRAFSAEVRATQKADGLSVLHGHAAVFDSDSEDMGGWVERIAPGAFDKVLEAEDIYGLWNHDPNFIIASTADKTLLLSQDKTGLLAEMDPMDTQTIRDLVVTPIQQGKVRKMSFAFDIAPEGAAWTNEKGRDVRTITNISRLYDVSPVTYPAYPGTDIASRTLRSIVRAFPRAQVLNALREEHGTQEECEADGGTWTDGMCVMPMMSRQMTQEDCEADGGTWDPDTEMCSMEASSAASRLTLPKGGRAATQDVWAEFYRNRMGLHDRLRFSDNFERKLT